MVRLLTAAALLAGLAYGEAQAAPEMGSATAATMTGTSSKDNHRRRIPDLRACSGHAFVAPLII